MFALFMACAERTSDVTVPAVPDGTETTPDDEARPSAFVEVFTPGTAGRANDWTCGSARDPDWQDWPGGLRMRLTTGPLLLDVPAEVAATGAVPGDTVVFHKGGLCALDCPADLDGACFQPVDAAPLGEAVAGEDGVARLVVTPDESWSGAWFVLQASVAGGRYLSQPVVDRGGPWPGTMFPSELSMHVGPATLRALRLVDFERFLWPVAPGRRARVALTCPDADCSAVERFVTSGGGRLAFTDGAAHEAWFAEASTWSVNAALNAGEYAVDLELLPAVAPVAWHVDADGDGWGDGLSAPTWSATPVPGATTALDDCADGDPARHPGAPEVCGDGEDQDCDGADRPCSRGDGPWAKGSAGTRVVGGALDSLGDLLHSGDLDGDGAPELVAGTELRGRYYRTHGAIVALADRRDRGPGEAWSWPAEYPLADIEIGDADGDGAADLVLAPLAGGSEVRTYLGPLDPGEPWGSDGSLVSGFSYGSKLTLGRLTDDGDPDLVFAIWQSRDERVGVLADPLLGGTSAFGVATRFDGGFALPEGDVAVQDIDGDGVDDLVTATACLYTGPVPSPPACVATPGTDRPISQSVAADVDGDGRADVAVAIGTSIYVHTSPWRDGAALGEGAWAEVDGVGFVKDVVFLRDGEALTLLRVDAADARGVPIDGPGLYEATDVWVEFDGTAPAVRAADLDEDGSPDLVLGFPEEDWMALPSAGAVWVLWGPG